MLNTEAPAMESSNGDAYPPAVDQTAGWSVDQVAPESLTAALPQDTDCPQEEPNQQKNSTQLGSVEQFQLYQEEQPPLPPQPPQPAEDAAKLPSEAGEAQQYNQEAAGNNESQGKQQVLSLTRTDTIWNVYLLYKVHLR